MGVLRPDQNGKLTREYGLHALWVTDEKDEKGLPQRFVRPTHLREAFENLGRLNCKIEVQKAMFFSLS